MADVKQGLPVTIRLHTKVSQEGEVSDFRFEMPGQVVTIGGTLYIRYKELQEETGEEVPVTMKISPEGTIQLIRAGESRLRMKFDYRKQMETNYRTPYGLFRIKTYTTDLHVSLKDQPYAGNIRLFYSLFSGEAKIGDYQLHLEFTA